TDHIREQETVPIPVSVILMPLPGAPFFGLFLHEFGMKMSDTGPQDFLSATYQSFSPRHQAVYAVIQIVPQGQPGSQAFRISAVYGFFLQYIILPGHSIDPFDLFRMKIPGEY